MISECTGTFQYPTDIIVFLSMNLSNTEVDSTEKKTQKCIKTNGKKINRLFFFEIFSNCFGMEVRRY